MSHFHYTVIDDLYEEIPKRDPSPKKKQYGVKQAGGGMGICIYFLSFFFDILRIYLFVCHWYAI